MRARLVIDVEVDDSMPLGELDGLALTLEQRKDVVTAYLRRAVIVMPKKEADRE